MGLFEKRANCLLSVPKLKGNLSWVFRRLEPLNRSVALGEVLAY